MIAHHFLSRIPTHPLLLKVVAKICLIVFLAGGMTGWGSVAGWGAVTVRADDDLTEVIERSEKGVVRIDVAGIGGEALGSGFIVESNGLLVTNVHVLAGASRAAAVFADGRSFDVVGTYLIDVNKDICVAKIEGVGFDTIPLADGLPRRGEQVVALGSPHGLSFSATRGIVSAIRQQDDFRQMVGRPRMEGTWVQVDAALSGGNSGGPLINSRGEVVAMSTFASVGDAQNLNFGVSVIDVRRAIDEAKRSQLVDLRAGIGRIEMADVMPESTGMIARGEIPMQALEDYIEQGRAEYRDLSSEIRRAASETRRTLDRMRRGETFVPAGANADVVVQRLRNTERYFFRSDAVKRRLVSEYQSRAAHLEGIVSQLSPRPDDESLFALLMNGGPRLDVRNAHKIGFMYDGVVLHAFNEHDVIVLYDGLPCLMWVQSTVGLAMGQEISPTPVYVAGTETMEIPGIGSQSVTVLNSVTESEMRQAIFGAAGVVAAADSELRTWTDDSGQFSIEARLIEVRGTQVLLERADGTQIEVPLDRLSEADRRLVRND